MLFDIRDQQKARDTLLRITGVPFDVWERETNHRNERFKYDDDFVDYVIQRHGCYNVRYEDLEFVFSHLTSSDNNCDSMKNTDTIVGFTENGEKIEFSADGLDGLLL